MVDLIIIHGTVIAMDPQRRVIEDGSLDFVFIDGDHAYEGVKRDIQDWIPLVKTNGTICFHDYRDAPGVKRAVDEITADGTIKLVKREGCIFMGRRN